MSLDGIVKTADLGGWRSRSSPREQFPFPESGPLRAVHLSRHEWPGGVVN